MRRILTQRRNILEYSLQRLRTSVDSRPPPFLAAVQASPPIEYPPRKNLTKKGLKITFPTDPLFNRYLRRHPENSTVDLTLTAKQGGIDLGPAWKYVERQYQMMQQEDYSMLESESILDSLLVEEEALEKEERWKRAEEILKNPSFIVEEPAADAYEEPTTMDEAMNPIKVKLAASAKKNATIGKMISLWNTRLAAASYKTWSQGQTASLDYFVAMSILGWGKRGYNEMMMEEQRDYNVRPKKKARSLRSTLQEVREGIFPETIDVEMNAAIAADEAQRVANLLDDSQMYTNEEVLKQYSVWQNKWKYTPYLSWSVSEKEDLNKWIFRFVTSKEAVGSEREDICRKARIDLFGSTGLEDHVLGLGEIPTLGDDVDMDADSVEELASMSEFEDDADDIAQAVENIDDFDSALALYKKYDMDASKVIEPLFRPEDKWERDDREAVSRGIQMELADASEYFRLEWESTQVEGIKEDEDDSDNEEDDEEEGFEEGEEDEQSENDDEEDVKK